MPVFISHKSTDSFTARGIHQYLTSRNVPCYIDVLDPALKTTNDITSVILDRLGRCTHLLAVVSPSTAESWWVPFEIGVGTAQDNRIASYKTSLVRMPDYLTKWPIMDRMEQLSEFVRLYNNDKNVLLQKSESMARIASIRSASDFHNQFKAVLGQR